MGPFGKLLAALLPLVGRGVWNAWKQASVSMPKDTLKNATIFGNKAPFSLDEAQQILGMTAARPMSLNKLQQHYERMYNQNDRSKGGSFYLQGKIFRAKERVDEAIASGEITLPRVDDGELPDSTTNDTPPNDNPPPSSNNQV